MNTALFISFRYLITKRKEKFISLISVISILGIAIGVMALIVVIGVMSGFDQDLRDKIVGNYSHITLNSYKSFGQQEFENIAPKIKANPAVKGLSPYLQGQVLARKSGHYAALGIKGIDPRTEAQVTNIEKYLVRGKLSDLADNTVIVGKELAILYGLRVGSTLDVYSPQVKLYPLRVVGIFNSGMYDYDLNLIFTDVQTGQDILGLAGQYSAVAIKLNNMFLADKVKNELSDALGMDYGLRTWMEMNQNFFSALALEKFAMFVILALIVLVASFNIISTLIVTVVEKTKDIGIFKAIGMTAADVRKIFTYLGFSVGLIGTVFGMSGGFTLCWLLKKYQFIKLPQDIYYLDKLPVSIQLWPDIILITGAAL
ncbi:MAG: ABC transporter permease [Candidatus Omnitrophica bacterium]|nr:ABC transporter permease [Candidatus Omnitrophota bacterium]